MMRQRWERLLPFEQLLVDDLDGMNPPIITALFAIDGELSKAWVLRHLVTPLTTHPRFCSVLTGRRDARFQLVPGFTAGSDALAQQVTVHTTTLEPDVLDELLSSPISRNRLLWHIDVFCASGATKTDVVFRVHHVIGDGVGLVRFFLSAVADHSVAAPATRAHHKSRTSRRALHDALTTRTGVLEAIKRPLRDAFCTLLMPIIPDSACALTRNTMCGRKRAAYARTRNVEALRSASRAVGVSINDLLLAAACGAIRAYTLKRGDAPHDLRRVRVGIPFNMHAANTGADFLHNAVVVMQLLAPLRQDDRTRRLANIVRQTRDLKTGARIRLSLIAFAIVAALPRFCRVRLWRHITRSVSLLLTNVPGPVERVRVAGRDLHDIRILAPSQGLAGMTISAISYMSTFNVSVYSDTSIVPDPAALLRLYDEELDELIAWIKEVAGVD